MASDGAAVQSGSKLGSTMSADYLCPVTAAHSGSIRNASTHNSRLKTIDAGGHLSWPVPEMWSGALRPLQW